MSQDSMILFVWVLLTIVVPTVIGTFMIVAPGRFIQIQARAYRKVYSNAYGISDKEVGKLPMLPTDRMLIRNMQEFIEIAPDHPEKFGNYIAALRLFGIALWVLALFFCSRFVVG